jgi:hypothetical protein
VGFSIRLAPGVRVRASSRGVRTSLGPRVARVHLGAGRPGISTGVGPVGYYTSLAPSRRTTSSSRRTPTASQQLAAARAAEKAEQAKQLADAITQLLNVHHEEFPPAQRPVATPPPAVDVRRIRAQHRQEARRSTGLFDRSARKAALAEADRRAQAEAAAMAAQFEVARAAWQNELNEQWARLLDNDPDMTLGTLAKAFEDNEAAAAPVGISDAEVNLVVIVPGPEAVPERHPTRTAAGNLSLKKLTKTESSALYTELVAGHLLVTVKEAFAVAPGLKSARIAAVRPSAGDAYGARRPEALIAARLERDRLTGVRWGTTEASNILAGASSELLINQKGATRALNPISLSREPEIGALLDSVDLEDLL